MEKWSTKMERNPWLRQPVSYGQRARRERKDKERQAFDQKIMQQVMSGTGLSLNEANELHLTDPHFWGIMAVATSGYPEEVLSYYQAEVRYFDERANQRDAQLLDRHEVLVQNIIFVLNMLFGE